MTDDSKQVPLPLSGSRAKPLETGEVAGGEGVGGSQRKARLVSGRHLSTGLH